MSVTFNTNQLKSRRKAVIDGHEYTVRKMSNIERLEILSRQDEVDKITKKYSVDALDSDYSKKDIDRIKENTRFVTEVIISLFDDGTKSQSKARSLVSSLDENDINDIIEAVFKQTEEKDGATS